MRTLLTISVLLPFWALAQSFDPAAGLPGSLAIHKDSALIKSWASECKVYRGHKDIAQPQLGRVNFGSEKMATGKSDPGVVSLGDSGVAVLSFDGIIYNGPGPDFCVFENGFGDNYLELAFVEVSSDGVNYFRFESVSESDTTFQTSNFDLTEPSHLFNLAGKYRAQYGTPFDLDELRGTVGLDIDSISHVRVVDVIGSVDPKLGSRDSRGNLINDPYPTAFHNNDLYTGGFDLDALGLINYSGQIFVGNAEVEQNQIFSFYPNPANDFIHFPAELNGSEVLIYSNAGELTGDLKIVDNRLPVMDLENGFYILQILGQGYVQRASFIISR